MGYRYSRIKEAKEENNNMYLIGYMELDMESGEGNTIQRFDAVNGKCPVKLISHNDNYAFFEVLEDCHAKYGKDNNILFKSGDKVMIDLNGEIFKIIL